MQELSLATAFRYLSASVIAWAYLAVLDWPTARAIVKWPFLAGGEVGATAFLAALVLASGTLIYFIYRALFFEMVVLRVDDGLRWWTDNYRTWLSKKYRLTLRESQALADLLGEKIPNRVSDGMARAHAGTHILYISGFVGIIECLVLRVRPKPFWLWVPDSTLSSLAWGWVFAFAMACLVAGLIQSRHQENHELLQFRDFFSDTELDKIVLGRALFETSRGDWLRLSDRMRVSLRKKFPRFEDKKK